MPNIVAAVHADLTWAVNDSGRCGLLSAERVFRSAVLKQLKGYSYRELRGVGAGGEKPPATRLERKLTRSTI